MLVRSKFWYLENFNFRHILTLEERKKVAEMVVMQTVPKKEVLYFSSQPSHCVYLLKEGKVKVYRKAADGKEIILNIIGPRGLFGELGLAGQEEREEVAEAIEDAIVCKITMEDMRELMDSIPSLNTENLSLL